MESLVKFTALVEIASEVLQSKLDQLRVLWTNNAQLVHPDPSELPDFFQSHPQKKWLPEELEMISTRNISQWDISLCSRWLLKFNWLPLLQNALSPAEEGAINALKQIRNRAKHHSSNTLIPDEEFERYCWKVARVGVILGQDKAVIEKKIQEVKTLVLVDGELLDGNWNYDTNRILGGGSYGIVLDATCRTDGVSCALKMIPLHDTGGGGGGGGSSDQETKKEAKNLARLNHPNVVQYKSSGTFFLPLGKFKQIISWEPNTVKLNEESERLLCTTFQKSMMESGNMVKGIYLAMEICGENLRNWLDRKVNSDSGVVGDERRLIASSLIQGLNYIHSQRIMHRDLRPANVLFSGTNYAHPVKIGDFGLSKQVKGYVTETMTRQAGCHLYRAPEVELNEDGKLEYSIAADYFSLGLIISEIFDPEPESKLKMKFNKIVFRRDVGRGNLEGEDFYMRFVLKVTNEEPKERYNFLEGTRIPLPLPWSDLDEIGGTPENGGSNPKFGTTGYMKRGYSADGQPVVVDNSPRANVSIKTV